MSCKKDTEKQQTKQFTTRYFKPYKGLKLSSGKLLRLDRFPSKFIKTRPVDVWLPENYSKHKKYNVLYMHDGQMLFDSITTWNKQEWKVDEWATQLIATQKTEPFIVVAIHNIRALRWFDLFPKKAASYIDEEVLETIKTMKSEVNAEVALNGDNYLKFIVQELKPIIDSEFSVYTSKPHTFIMGSSMGGLMSMYAILEYPEVFQGAACLSTHWPGVTPVGNYQLAEAIFKYMEAHLPPAENHSVYFDYGTETLDAHYPKYASRVSEIFMTKGYTDTNFKNLKFEGANHSENAWNKRLDVPLLFLMGNE